MCIRYPRSKWFMGRNELKRLMGSSFVTFLKVCQYHKIPRSMWKVNRQYNYIEFENGSRIDLLDFKYQPSDPLYERFGSLEYTGGWIEEAGEVDFGAFDVLKSRINRHMNKEYDLPPKMLITCNPKKNWLYATVYKPSREKRLPTQYKFIQSLYKDNPYTADTYGKSLDEMKDKSLVERLKYGNWEYDNDPSKLTDYDSICELFTTLTPKSEDRYLSIDVARLGKDKAVIMQWEGFQVVKVHVYKRSSIDFLQEKCRDICNKHRIPRAHVIADEDGVGGGFVDNFKCKGFVNNAAPIQPRVALYQKDKRLNYLNLKAQCGVALAQKINKREIGINPTKWEEYIKEELEQLKKKEMRLEGRFRLIPKEEMRDNLGRSPDFMDALLMRMWFELQPQRRKDSDREYEDAINKFAGKDSLRSKMHEDLGFLPEDLQDYNREAHEMLKE